VNETTSSDYGDYLISTNTTFTNGFWWNGVWNEVKPSAGDDDGPPTGVREPRRPRPHAPAGAAALELESV
jgi:hypothetical protein